MVSLLRRAFVAGLCAAALLARAADPVAFICDIKGDVTVDGARPTFLSELLPGSRLVVAPGAAAAVMYVVSGEEFALKGPGEFIVGRESVTAASGAAPAKRRLATQADAAVIVQASRAGTASLRMRSTGASKPDPAGPRYPVGAVAQLQPTLQWNGDPAATYEVVVTAASGKQVHAGPVKGTTLKLPSKLIAGQSYTWSVTAPGLATSDARFEVLQSDAVAQAEKARAAAKTFGDRVQVALLLQGMGATADARDAWQRLATERPDIPELKGLARP